MRSAAAAHAVLSAISTAIVDLDGVPAAHFETDHPCATGVAIDHSFRSRTRFGTLRASSLTYDVRTFRSLKTAASLFPTVGPNDVVARGSRRNSLVRRRRSWIARERMSQNPPAEACQSTIVTRSVTGTGSAFGKLGVGDATAGSSYGTRTVEHSPRHFTRRVAPQSCASKISARLRADPSDRARISDLSANSARRQERANSTARFALSAIAA